MAGTTVLPPALLPRRSAANLTSCSSRVRLNPTLMANPAAAKRPKRPGSVHDVQPPAPKRVRGASSGGEVHVAVATTKSPESVTQPKPQMSMRQLIEKARLTMALRDKARSASEEEASRRHDIEHSRAEARRKMELMADTVQFNDPWIDPSDLTKSPEELLQARQNAWRYQAHLIEMARRRDFAQAMQIHG